MSSQAENQGGMCEQSGSHHELAAVVPSDEAACAGFFDGTASDFVGRCASPAASNNSNEEPLDYFSRRKILEPKEFITDEMLETEKKLQANGIKEEEKRQEENIKILQEMTEDTREKRYERLKYLLSKSTLYTQYLVDRIKKQKEEEQQRRERIQKRKQKKEENAIQQEKQASQEETASPKATRKRKQQDDSEPASQSPTVSKNKKQKTSENSQSGSQDVKQEQPDDTEHPIIAEEGGDKEEGNKEAREEPQLLDKASTFGILEEENERVINGEAVPSLQPKLLEGGVLRPYQVEGYSWLKVLYENGVNGILADEMGLGKTIQCVAIVSHLVYMGIPGPFLVCAPLSTIPNWFSEFEKFAPNVPIILYHGDKNRRQHLSKRIYKKYQIRDGVKVQPVVITSYEMAIIDRAKLAHHDWKYLVVDEGHRIKNTHCRLIRELRMYRSTHRLLLTGTPLQNNMAELWSLLNFLLPEIFDDLGSFEAWFDVKSMNDGDSDEQIVKQEQGENILSMLHQILAPFMLRRLKTDVDLCIPPKKEVMVFAPLAAEQKEYYEALVNRTIFSFIEDKNTVEEEEQELTTTGRPKRRSSKKVDYNMFLESDDDKKRNDRQDKGVTRRWKYLDEEEKELEDWVSAVCDNGTSDSDRNDKPKTSQVTIKMRCVMMQLRKCCNHPYLLEHPVDPKTGDLALNLDVIKKSGKMMVLDKMLKELKKRGHRVLIFSQMTRMLDLIEDFCQLRGYEFCRLDGSTGIDDRRERMNEFNAEDSDKFLFLLSTRAGGLGINLVGADTVIIYDSDWNPQCDLQAQDRCHRIGQTKPVVVYRFVTTNTIDQRIIERAAAKRKLEKMIIHKGKFKSGNFMSKAKPISPEELRDLLKSKDHENEVNNTDFSISQAQLDLLLDRSDLIEKWELAKGDNMVGIKEKPTTSSNDKKTTKSKKKSTKASKAQPDQGLFKVIENGHEVLESNVPELSEDSESSSSQV